MTMTQPHRCLTILFDPVSITANWKMLNVLTYIKTAFNLRPVLQHLSHFAPSCVL